MHSLHVHDSWIKCSVMVTFTLIMTIVMSPDAVLSKEEHFRGRPKSDSFDLKNHRHDSFHSEPDERFGKLGGDRKRDEEDRPVRRKRPDEKPPRHRDEEFQNREGEVDKVAATLAPVITTPEAQAQQDDIKVDEDKLIQDKQISNSETGNSKRNQEEPESQTSSRDREPQTHQQQRETTREERREGEKKNDAFHSPRNHPPRKEERENQNSDKDRKELESSLDNVSPKQKSSVSQSDTTNQDEIRHEYHKKDKRKHEPSEKVTEGENRISDLKDSPREEIRREVVHVNHKMHIPPRRHHHHHHHGEIPDEKDRDRFESSQMRHHDHRRRSHHHERKEKDEEKDNLIKGEYAVDKEDRRVHHESENKFLRVENGPRKDTTMFSERQAVKQVIAEVKTPAPRKQEESPNSDLLTKLLDDPKTPEKLKKLLKMTISADVNNKATVELHEVQQTYQNKAASVKTRSPVARESNTCSSRPKCEEVCEFFPKLDANGCESCECCSMSHFSSCHLECNRGFKADNFGCPICSCI